MQRQWPFKNRDEYNSPVSKLLVGRRDRWARDYTPVIPDELQSTRKED